MIVRENTEDLYAGIEHMVGRDAAESIKIITREASERIARFAFEYAVANGRRKVTAVHKANIMKLSDGLFLESCRTVAADYEGRIEFEDRIVDNMCMQLVQKPELYDVMVLPNLYGDIVSDLCAGLVGGLGVAPGANIGIEASVFEPVHGSAPKYAGQNKANPTALLLSGVLHAAPPRRAGGGGARRGRPARGHRGGEGHHLRPGRTGGHPRVRRRHHRAARLIGGHHRTATRRRGPEENGGSMLLRYRGSEGMLAWAFHRISGVAIWAFILLHVLDIWLVGAAPDLYNEVLAIYASPFGRVVESLLGAALLYHALNGLRIIIMDFWPAMTRYHKQLWYLNWVLFLVIGAPDPRPDHGSGLRDGAPLQVRLMSTFRVTRAGRARPAGSGFELAVWYLIRLTGIGLFVLALAHYIVVHFVFDPAYQDAAWVTVALGEHGPADDRLADAGLRPVPCLHGHAHGHRRLRARAASAAR